MKKNSLYHIQASTFFKVPLLLLLCGGLTSCEYIKKMEKKAKVINHYQSVALELEKENRELKTQISKNEFQIQKLKAKNNFLRVKLKIEHGEEEEENAEELGDHDSEAGDGDSHGNEHGDVHADHGSDDGHGDQSGHHAQHEKIVVTTVKKEVTHGSSHEAEDSHDQAKAHGGHGKHDKVEGKGAGRESQGDHKEEKKHDEASLQNDSLNDLHSDSKALVGHGKNEAAAQPVGDEKDLVKFSVYHWKDEQLLSIGEDAFAKKEFSKSAQYLSTLVKEYPKFKKIDDGTLFLLGVASYKSQRHYDWAIEYLGRLVSTYPTSKYYRGAKLWMALSHYKQGKQKEFFATVEEFRLKYRNTPEWKVLSNHYEELALKFKK